jgi:hypothetical protein
MERRWPVLLLVALVVAGGVIGVALGTGSSGPTVRVADDPPVVSYDDLGPVARNVTDEAVAAGETTVPYGEYPTESALPQPRASGGGLDIGERKEKLVVRDGAAYRFVVAVGRGFNITVSNYTTQVVVDNATLSESVQADVTRARRTGENVTLGEEGPFATGGYVYSWFGNDAYYMLETDDGYVTLYLDRSD